MPIYISRGRFTADAVKGMLAKPENREEAVAKLVKSLGGRLIGWYLTFGHYDCPFVSFRTRRPQLRRCWLRRREAVCLTLRRPSL